MKFAIAMSAGLVLGFVGTALPANAASCTRVGNKMVCNNPPPTLAKGGSLTAPKPGVQISNQALKPSSSIISSNSGGLGVKH
jgi:hypothetical protein